ncbi:MAG: L,D-transpeptidase [Pseudomonadota bacterium]
MRILIRFTILFALLLVFLIMNGDSFAARGWLLQTLCDDPRLYCIVVRKGETWDSLFPDPGRRDLVMRINRMNTRIWPGMRIAIPRDPYSADSMQYTPFSPYRVPSGRKMIVYSPALNAWAAYGPAGNIIRWGPGSGGQDWCPDIGRPCHTPSGNFHVYEKRGFGCASTKFPKPDGGAPMPYCMFFKGGFAMHGSRGVPGYNASHGCVRIFVDDAEWLNKDFANMGTQVIILPYPFHRSAPQAQLDEEDDDDSDDGEDIALDLDPVSVDLDPVKIS